MITLYGFANIFPGIRSTTLTASSIATPTSESVPHGKLIPSDVQGRTRVVQWCFAAMDTVEPTMTCLDVVDIFDSGNHELRADVRKLADRWLGDVERRLGDRKWSLRGATRREGRRHPVASDGAPSA